MNHSITFHARKAISLVELTLTLSLAAIVVFNAIRAYSAARENSLIVQTSAEIAQARSLVETFYAARGDYQGVSASLLTLHMPVQFINADGSIGNPFRGLLGVLPDTSGSAAADSFTIAVTNIPRAACIRLAGMEQGRSLAQVLITANGGVTVATSGFNMLNGAPIADILASCSGDQNAIAYRFGPPTAP